MEDIIQQIMKFMAEAKEKFTLSRYVSNNLMTIYIRKSYRHINHKSFISFDIANIIIFNKSKGTFKRLIEEIKKINIFDGILVECVENPRLVKHLANNGWQLLPSEGNPSFWVANERNDNETGL